MNIQKFSALTLVGLVACLILLTPYPSNDVTPKGPSETGFPDSTAKPRQNYAISFNNPKTEPPFYNIQPTKARQKLAEHPGPVTEALAVDLPKILYPELVRIAELENESVDTALGELMTMLQNDDPVIRLAVIESLGDMINQASLHALSAALNDSEPQLRIAVLEALASQTNKSAASSIEPYLYDYDADVRIAAINALADLEANRAVHSLASLLFDADPRIRIHAVYALGEIGGDEALSYLRQALYDPMESISRNAEAIIVEFEHAAAN